jgi:hypothetical protein
MVYGYYSRFGATQENPILKDALELFEMLRKPSF